MIGIIDYGSGNIAALTNIFKQSKLGYKLCASPQDLAEADRFLLPGVGAFDPTMEQLGKSGLLAALEEQVIGLGKPVLGICVGMHLLSDGSDEGDMPGLGWISGRVRKIDASKLNSLPHLPHMGWNSIALSNVSPLFDQVDVQQGYYFLHSYYFDAETKADVTATVTFGAELPCAVARANVHGVQFHPEKSHSNGVTLLKNFANLV